MGVGTQQKTVESLTVTRGDETVHPAPRPKHGPNETLFRAERRSETLLPRPLLRPHEHINLIIRLKIEEKGEINFSLMNMD